MYDRIDLGLLKRCKAKPGKELIEVIKPFLKQPGSDDPDKLSEVQLRERIKRLEDNGLVNLDRTRRRGRIYCEVTPEGEKTLREYEESHPGGGDSHGL